MEDFLNNADKLCEQPFDKHSVEANSMINTSSSSTKETYERIKFESYELIWLTSHFPTFSINNSDKTVTFENLKAIVDKTMIFNNVEQCQEYLRQSDGNDTTTFLVCCDPLAKMFIPQLVDYNNIRSIYILSQNQEDYQQLTAKNPKIKQIYETLSTLVFDLFKDLKEFKKHQDRVIFTQIKLKAKEEEEEEEEENSTVVAWSWWIKFTEVLLYLPYPIDCCRQRLYLLKKYYVGNTTQINLIDEFQLNYNRNDPIRWYSRDTFLYRLLNEAFRKRNVELMFLFGYFIQDLYKQLTHEYEEFRFTRLNDPIMIAYRGQIMSRNEVNELKSSRRTTNSSFFSTTLHRHLATAFLNPLAEPDDEMQNVLFQVKIDLKLQTRPFANISHLSNFQDEDEILFMFGTLFEVDTVVYDEMERFWLIQLELVYDENIKDIREFESELSSRKTLKNCANKLTAFNIYGLENVDPKERIFNELTELFPQESKWFSALKFQSQSEEQRLIGEEEFQNEIITNYETAIKIWQDYQDDNDELNCSIELGKLHKDIGEYYGDEIYDNKMADKYYDLAIHYYQYALEKESSDYDKMKIYDQLSVVFQLKMKPMMVDDEQIYEGTPEKEQAVMMAAKYKELYVEYMSKFYSSDHIEIGRTYEYLAYLYKSIDKFEDASTNYEKALNVFLQNSYLEAVEVEHLLNNIVYLHMDDRHDYQTALRYQLMNHEYIMKMIEKSKSNYYVNHKRQSMANSHIQLSDIYSLLHQKDLASDNLTTAMNLYNEIDDDMSDRFHKEEKLALIEEKMKKLTKVSFSPRDNCKRFKSDSN